MYELYMVYKKFQENIFIAVSRVIHIFFFIYLNFYKYIDIHSLLMIY